MGSSVRSMRRSLHICRIIFLSGGHSFKQMWYCRYCSYSYLFMTGETPGQTVRQDGQIVLAEPHPGVPELVSEDLRAGRKNLFVRFYFLLSVFFFWPTPSRSVSRFLKDYSIYSEKLSLYLVLDSMRKWTIVEPLEKVRRRLNQKHLFSMPKLTSHVLGNDALSIST